MADGSGTVSVLLGNGDGTFQAPMSVLVGNAPFSVVVGDFNGDGAPDLAMIGANDVSVLLGTGEAAPRSRGSGRPSSGTRAVSDETLVTPIQS